MGYLVFHYFQKRRKLNESKVSDISSILEKEQDFKQVSKWVMSDKKYLDPNLKLDKVAKGVRLSEKQVSTAINTIACQNFNAYINRLRIKEAQRMLTDDNYNHFTIDALAEMVGFSNKVSFYNAFKKETGDSPSGYKKASNQLK